MSRLVHIALKCADRESLDAATKFYEDIFGLYTTKEKHARGHLSRHMTDGNIDLALMLYDSEDEKEAKLAGPGIQIHHIGVEVADRPSMIKKIEDNGGRIFSDRAEGALKYFAADGTLGEIVAAGRYPTDNPAARSRIINVSYQVADVEKAADFYRNVYAFAEVAESKPGARVFTDGIATLSLFQEGDRPAIQSWTLEVEDPAAVARQVEAQGGQLLGDGNASHVRFRGPDGNVAELVAAAAAA